MNIEDTHVSKKETLGNLNRFTQTKSNCQYSGPQIRSSSFRSKIFSLDFDSIGVATNVHAVLSIPHGSFKLHRSRTGTGLGTGSRL